MSIIYDALKKVEATAANDPKTEIKKSTKPKTNIYLLYALMICLVLLIAIIFSDWFFQEVPLKITGIAAKTQSNVDNKELVSQPSGKTPVPEINTTVGNVIETSKETPPLFVLNGVFFSGAEGYALINNRIVKKGDKVDGATVTQIFLDEVELDFGGSTIKLSNSVSK